MQGSAADFCKAAMVALHARASAAFVGRPEACRLILQASTLKRKLASAIANTSLQAAQICNSWWPCKLKN